jgi:glucokinase
MVTDRKDILALDYGGTKLSAALCGYGRKEWKARERCFSQKGASAHNNQEVMLQMAHRLVESSGADLAAVGISFGGPVHFPTGMIRLSHHVPGWEDIPLRDELAEEFGVPAVVDNDANVAAFGEWSRGAGQYSSSMLYMTISTGIGGGWVLGGQIFRGADGMAGEIGHTIVNPGGAVCSCGKKGCLEAESCGPAIARKALARLTREPDASPILLEKAEGDPAGITAAMIAEAAEENDELSILLLREAASYVGSGLAMAINLINPERIVLGGGVSKSGGVFWKTLQQTTEYFILPQMQADIRPAALGDDAPLWGAVAMAEKLLSQ